ncbi:hypothetical protein HZS_675 [Henneguya salminicola]|nr:hypothetical protein HZS_675 [Henneguya salminicola]
MLPSKESLKFLTNYLPFMKRILQLLYPATLYVNEHLFRKNIKILLSHAFCSPGSVRSCFESFEKHMIENSQMNQIMIISSDDLTKNIRQQPLFAINLLELGETFIVLITW